MSGGEGSLGETESEGDGSGDADASPRVSAPPGGLTHLDATGAAHMVDVGAKAITARTACARALVRMQPATRAALLAGSGPKGDALQVARVAGIQATKRTAELIPLCHPLPLDAVEVRFAPVEQDAIEVRCTARVTARTGVEMEALTGASLAALTIYDMVKAIDRGVTIESILLLEKTGGRSGTWTREAHP